MFWRIRRHLAIIRFHYSTKTWHNFSTETWLAETFRTIHESIFRRKYGSKLRYMILNWSSEASEESGILHFLNDKVKRIHVFVYSLQVDRATVILNWDVGTWSRVWNPASALKITRLSEDSLNLASPNLERTVVQLHTWVLKRVWYPKSPRSWSERTLVQILIWYRVLARFLHDWTLNFNSGRDSWRPWVFQVVVSGSGVEIQSVQNGCPEFDMCFSAEMDSRPGEARLVVQSATPDLDLRD